MLGGSGDSSPVQFTFSGVDHGVRPQRGFDGRQRAAGSEDNSATGYIQTLAGDCVRKGADSEQRGAIDRYDDTLNKFFGFRQIHCASNMIGLDAA
jgi:hypothetical protein